MPFEFGNGEPQRILCNRLGDRVGDRPHAEFVVSQSGLEIGHGSFEQIFLGLVEDANMRSPSMLLMTRMPVSRNAGSAAFGSADPDSCRSSAEALPAGACALEPDTNTSKSLWN